MADAYDLDYEFRLAEGPVKLFRISLDARSLFVIILNSLAELLIMAFDGHLDNVKNYFQGG